LVGTIQHRDLQGNWIDFHRTCLAFYRLSMSLYSSDIFAVKLESFRKMY